MTDPLDIAVDLEILAASAEDQAHMLEREQAPLSIVSHIYGQAFAYREAARMVRDAGSPPLTTAAIASRVQEYMDAGAPESRNIWQDIILGLPGYHEPTVERIDPDEFLVSGIIYRLVEAGRGYVERVSA